MMSIAERLCVINFLKLVVANGKELIIQAVSSFYLLNTCCKKCLKFNNNYFEETVVDDKLCRLS
jgi:hypothetical protein